MKTAFVALITASLCTLPGLATAGTDDAKAITRISLERTMCLGSCPAYTVTLHADGRARYHGKAHSRLSGRYQGKVSTWTFKRLARLLVKQGFFQLRPSYRARATCQASTILTVHRGKKVTRVEDYGYVGPVSLWGLQQAIDAVGHDLTWRRRGATPPPLSTDRFAKKLEQQLISWRTRTVKQATVADPGLRMWGLMDARRVCGASTRGTVNVELAGSASVRLTSVGLKDLAGALQHLTNPRDNLLLRKKYRRLAVAAAHDPQEGHYCVVIYLGVGPLAR